MATKRESVRCPKCDLRSAEVFRSDSLSVLLCRNLDCRYQGRHTEEEVVELAKSRKPGPKGKLLEAQVLEIRKQAAAGAKYTALARQYNCSVANIEKIVQRETWRYL